MRAAVATCLEVDEEKVTVDAGSGMVEVDLGGGEADMDAVAKAFEGTKYSVAD